MDFKRTLAGAAGLALLVLVLAMPLPSFVAGSRVFSSIEDASHGPLFAALICLDLPCSLGVSRLFVAWAHRCLAGFCPAGPGF
jgi:hypothetical protein